MRPFARLASRLVAITLSTVVVAIPLPARAAAGDEMLIGAPGQPVCADRDALLDFTAAMIIKDGSRMRNIRTCLFVTPGVPVIVVEELPGDSAFGHVDQIKAAIPNGGIVFGYVMSRGLVPLK